LQKAIAASELRDARPLSPTTPLWRKIAQPLLTIAVIALSVLAMNRMIASAPEKVAKPFTAPVLTVDAIVAKAERQQPTIRAFGEIINARSLDIRAPVAGEILEIAPSLASGGKIAKGELIARIDEFEYQGAIIEAEANLAQARFATVEIEARLAAENDQIVEAELQAKLATDDLARAEDLRRSGGLTQRQLEERRLIVSQRSSALAQRRNNIAIEQSRLDQQAAQVSRLQWRVDQARRNLENTRLAAPFNAIVQTATATTGRRVAAGEVIAVLVADNEAELQFTISERDYQELLKDDAPIIGRAVAFASNEGEQGEASIVRVLPVQAGQSGTVTLIASVALQEGSVALPGSFVEVTLPGRSYDNAVRVAESSIYEGGTVYLIDAGSLAPVKATVLGFDGDDAILAGDGIAGKQVLATRLADIAIGQKVTINGEAPVVDKPSTDASVKP
jgi:multidrug efflux pump subunit AcrA (membrane-fusion protein)